MNIFKQQKYFFPFSTDSGLSRTLEYLDMVKGIASQSIYILYRYLSMLIKI